MALFVFWEAESEKNSSHVSATVMAPLSGVYGLSSDKRVFMNSSDGIVRAYQPLGDILQEHLTGCAQCQASLSRTPTPNLNPTGTTGLCSKWFQIIREWADEEGKVNNVVAEDEYGNQAIRSTEQQLADQIHVNQQLKEKLDRYGRNDDNELPRRQHRLARARRNR